jgi:diguanylate cyclase (GGDEF)-like protein/PAS domain S-box-containing protein
MAGVADLARDKVLRGLIVLAVIITVVYSAGWGSVEDRVWTFWLVQVALDVTFVVLCVRVVRMLAERPAQRRFWRWVTIGGLFYTAGDTSQTIVALTHPGAAAAAGGNQQTLFVLTGGALTILAMLRYPTQAPGRQRERLKWWLDAATILVAVAAFMWVYFAGRPASANPVPMGVLLLGGGLSFLAAFGLTKFLIGGNAPFTVGAGTAAGISAILIGISTAFASVPGSSLALTVTILFRLLPCVLLAAVPRIQELQVRANPEVLTRQRRPYSRLPYLAIASTQLLLIVVLRQGRVDIRVWGVVGAVVLGTALVIVRQLVAFADNARLLASLDQTTLDLRRQEQRFRSLVQRASDITLVVSEDGTLTYVSPATTRVLGAAPEKFVGTRVRDLVHPDDIPTFNRAAGAVLTAGHRTVTCDLRAQHADGSWRWLEIISTNLLDDPSVGGIICNIRDVTEARQFGERLRHEATHDPLTGLANRALFNERIKVDPAAGLVPEEPVAILTIDLDDFKAINDTRGHPIGDRLLTAVAGRLLNSVRNEDTVARVGGDEFAILLPGASRALATALARRILGVLSEPFLVDGDLMSARASIGVAVGPRSDAEALLRASDASMYEAKQGGKSRFVIAATGR